MNELTPLQRRVLVEKHLISPNLAGPNMEHVCYQKANTLV